MTPGPIRVALGLALLACRAGATNTMAHTDATHQPLSAPELGGGSLYAGYDIFGAFVNPALLSRQSTAWQAGVADSAGFGGDSNAYGFAAGWLGEQGESGGFGLALLGGGISSPSFKELDLFGQPTGVTVAPAVQQLAITGVYQWNYFSLGVGFHMARQTFGSLPASYTDGVTNADGALEASSLSLGTVISLGRLDLGAAYGIEENGSLRIGGAFHSKGAFNGDVGMDAYIPFSSNSGTMGGSEGGVVSEPSTSGFLQVGVTWHPSTWLDVRAGFQAPLTVDNSQTLRAGIGIPWKAYAFSYGMALPLGPTGHGSTHLLTVSWRGGASRKAAATPSFFLGQADRTMAVAAFDPQGVGATDAAIISDMVRSRLIKEGAFNIVEKANMDKILGEQAFQQTGCTSAECAVKLGKVLNVKYLVVGSFGKLLDRYVVSMRVVDVETAKGVYSDEAAAADVPGVQDAVSKLAANLTEAVKKAK